ncbi:hypothetical protein FRC03_010971 [Tulasnella sp. 419]|nr:hypothetical protein FRC03_010971 [Tulasnella sp. 419]
METTQSNQSDNQLNVDNVQPSTDTQSVNLADYKVWNPPHSSPATPGDSQSLPDTFFEPTTEELKSVFAQQSRLTQNLVNAPLKTQAIREREDKEKQARFPTTRIRVKFPNQLILERTFPSTDKIKSVYAWVRNSLTEEAKPIKFVLYQTPPRRELRVSDTTVKFQNLYQLHLAPSSILHLSFEEASLNSQVKTPPLLPEILALATDLPPPPTFDDTPKSDDKGKGRSFFGGSGESSTSGDSKLPKWLKLSGKK